jgi:hypothetical protein
VDADAVSPGVKAEHLHPSPSRAKQAEQQPDSRGLPRAIRTQVPEDLALLDRQVDTIEGAVTPIVLGQPNQANDVHDRSTSFREPPPSAGLGSIIRRNPAPPVGTKDLSQAGLPTEDRRP